MLAAALLAASVAGLPGEKLPAPSAATEQRGRAAVAEHLEERARDLLAPWLAERGLALGEPTVRRGRGTWHFTFPQVVDGVEVRDAVIVVSLRPGRHGDFAVSDASSTLVEGLVPRDADVLRTEAEEIAEAELRDLKPEPPAVVGKAFGTRRIVEPRSGEPAWATRVRGEDPPVVVEVVVSAVDGRVLDVRELTRQLTGRGRVFRPNPVVSLADAALADGSDADEAVPDHAYVDVVLDGLAPAVNGRYRLRGDNVVMSDARAPADVQAEESSADAFTYARGDARFEQVMVYYHVDQAVRYVRSLGFPDAFSRPLLADAHALTSDQSYFDPTDFSLNFGDGGVDDAEDADIIVHELGHALQEDLVPGFGTSPEAGALGEGFGDYLAASRREALGSWAACVGSWDATAYDGANDPPCLRRVDGGKKYPGDVQRNVHEDGEIWSSALWRIRQRLGATAADRLIIQSHLGLRPDASFRDAGLALVRADADLGLGRRGDVCAVLTDVGILGEAECPPDLAVEEVLVDDAVGGDGDGFLEPGESASLRVRVRSHASTTLANAAVVLTPRTGAVMDQPRATFGAVPAGATMDAATPLPRITVPAGVACGSTITFDAAITATGFSGTGTATLRLAEVVQLPPVIEAGRDVPLAIPDADGRGVTSRLTLAGAGTVDAIAVSVDLAHPYRGDLSVDLISPAGTRVTLHQRAGGSSDDLVTTYPTISAASGPGSLDALKGQPVAGTWSLLVKDWSADDTGTLRGWSLEIASSQATCNATSSCPGLEVATDSVRVTKLPGGAIAIGVPAARSACALGVQVRMSQAPRPSAGAGRFPDDPAFVDVTAQDAVPGGPFTHVPPPGACYYVLVETLPGGRVGPSGAYDR